MPRTNISSGAQWEPIVGYSRAVRIGNTVAVSGSVGVNVDGSVAAGDAYAQAKRALEIIIAALAEAGASAKDVIRTRTFVADISLWREVGRAHAEVFGDIRPATTMVQVSALIDPAYLLEIEADAVLE
jgi:enamine deaminase RidA (YjgF/YER057c/UK114 family)